MARDIAALEPAVDDMAEAVLPLEGRSRGFLKGDDLTDQGRALREDIEAATDHMEQRVVAALGDDADRLFAMLDPWGEQIVAAGGYPVRVTWPS